MTDPYVVSRAPMMYGEKHQEYTDMSKIIVAHTADSFHGRCLPTILRRASEYLQGSDMSLQEQVEKLRKIAEKLQRRLLADRTQEEMPLKTWTMIARQGGDATGISVL